MFSSLLIDYCFVVAVILIWFMVGYQLLLWALGYLYSKEVERERSAMDACPQDEPALPPVTILLPAHNEEMVIERTLQALQALRYPADRLEILVINDASTDRTGELVARMEACREDGRPRIRLLDIPVGVGGRGKAAALNAGLRQATHPILAVYDADNTPEPQALAYLVRQLERHPDLAAVLGKFRTVNRRRNLLTRFLNIEGISFQRSEERRVGKECRL